MGSPHYGSRYGGWAHLKLSIPRRERFLVPIRATGGGALLDMPDELDFGLSPVKYESPKTIMDARPALEAKFWDLEKPRKNVENTGNIRTWEAQVQQREITRDCLISWFSGLVDEYDCSSTSRNYFNRIARAISEYLTICAQHTCRYTILNIGDDLYPICLGGSSS